jgi:hypothetical protein
LKTIFDVEAFTKEDRITANMAIGTGTSDY